MSFRFMTFLEFFRNISTVESFKTLEIYCKISIFHEYSKILTSRVRNFIIELINERFWLVDASTDDKRACMWHLENMSYSEIKACSDKDVNNYIRT